MTLLATKDKAIEVTTKVTEVTEGEEATEVAGMDTLILSGKDAMYA